MSGSEGAVDTAQSRASQLAKALIEGLSTFDARSAEDFLSSLASVVETTDERLQQVGKPLECFDIVEGLRQAAESLNRER